MNSRPLTRTLLSALLAAGLVAPGALAAAGFGFSCQIVDTLTQQARETFAPGDSFDFIYSLDVPPEAADKEINLKLSARIRVGAIAIPYALDELKVSLPNTDFLPEDSEDESGLPLEGAVSERSTVDIPQGFPEGSATLRAKATIEDVGKGSCEVRIEVVANN